MRIAIIGGTDYLPEVFEDWLYKLHAKHPDAVIITGTATGKNIYEERASGKKEKVGTLPSAESMAASLMPGLGHTIEMPDMTTKTALYLKECKMSLADLQLAWILGGQWELYVRDNGGLNHRWITPRADIIVAVGNIESSRAAAAHDHWKKFDAWRDPENRRTFVSVAAPKTTKATAKRRPKKRVEQLAV